MNMGFRAAITNPFTIGIAQTLAGLPLFSGAWLRVITFVVIYVIFAIFLVRYARKVEKKPELSPVFVEDQASRMRYSHLQIGAEKLNCASGQSSSCFSEIHPPDPARSRCRLYLPCRRPLLYADRRFALLHRRDQRRASQRGLSPDGWQSRWGTGP